MHGLHFLEFDSLSSLLMKQISYPTPDSNRRFSEKVFRIYEPIAANAIQFFPAPYKLLPSELGLSPATFESRFRDAIRAYCSPRCTWQSTVDRKRLHEIFHFLGSTDPGAYRISVEGQHIHFSRRSLGVAESRLLALTTSGHSTAIDCSLDPRLLPSVCVLVSYGYLTTPIELTGISAVDADNAENTYPKVTFLDQGDNSFTLI